MNRTSAVAALMFGLALVAPGCSTYDTYRDHPGRYGNRYSAYDEGYRRGLIDGRWAAHRDASRHNRRSFWDDPRYRRGTEGYRSHFGSRTVYADGFRAGYEQGYRERRSHDRRDGRR